jgi:hypothetical protein
MIVSPGLDELNVTAPSSFRNPLSNWMRSSVLYSSSCLSMGHTLSRNLVEQLLSVARVPGGAFAEFNLVDRFHQFFIDLFSPLGNQRRGEKRLDNGGAVLESAGSHPAIDELLHVIRQFNCHVGHDSLFTFVFQRQRHEILDEFARVQLR